MTFDWHRDPISRDTPVDSGYRNTQNVRRFMLEHCDEGFRFDREFMAWILSGAPKVMGDVVDEWLRRNRQPAAEGQPFTPQHVALHPRDGRVHRRILKQLAALPIAERIDFLKQLWSLDFRYTLKLFKGARLPAQESQQLFRHWLQVGHHNAAQALIEHVPAVLGERIFWRIVVEEPLTPTMLDFLNYYGKGRLKNPESTP